VREFPISRRRFSASICFAFLQYLVSAYREVAWYTVAIQLFTRWMWTDASRLNQSRLIYVNTVIVEAIECSVFKKTNSFCDVIKGRSSSNCDLREISTASQEICIFSSPGYYINTSNIIWSSYEKNLAQGVFHKEKTLQKVFEPIYLTKEYTDHTHFWIMTSVSLVNENTKLKKR